MSRAYLIFRLVLTTLVCVGFCGLNWAQLSDAPRQTRSEQQVIQEFSCEDGVVFAVNHENSVNCQAQAGQGGDTPFIFGLGESFTPATPVFAVTGRVIESVTKTKSVLSCRMKNRDPPVI